MKHAFMEKHPKWTVFTVGLTVRLMGVGLIWLGDGHNDIFHKGFVISGVILSIGGIGILRYLLISGLHKSRTIEKVA